MLLDMLQRYEVVNGVVEVEGVTTEATMEEEDKEAEGYSLICKLLNSFSLF